MLKAKHFYTICVGSALGAEILVASLYADRRANVAVAEQVP